MVTLIKGNCMFSAKDSFKISCPDWKINTMLHRFIFYVQKCKMQIFCNRWLKIEPGVCDSSGQAAEHTLGAVLHGTSITWMTALWHFLWFYARSGHHNLHPHAWTASISLHDPPPRTKSNFWVCSLIWVKLWELHQDPPIGSSFLGSWWEFCVAQATSTFQ